VVTQLGEQLVHLTQIGGVAVGIEQGGGGGRVCNVDGNDGVPSFGTELQNVDVFPGGHPRHLQLPGDFIHPNAVRRRIGGEKRELRRHRRRHRPHS